MILQAANQLKRQGNADVASRELFLGLPHPCDLHTVAGNEASLPCCIHANAIDQRNFQM